MGKISRKKSKTIAWQETDKFSQIVALKSGKSASFHVLAPSKTETAVRLPTPPKKCIRTRQKIEKPGILSLVAENGLESRPSCHILESFRSKTAPDTSQAEVADARRKPAKITLKKTASCDKYKAKTHFQPKIRLKPMQTVQCTHFSDKAVQQFTREGDTFAILAKNAKIAVFGAFELTVLVGHVEILGHRLTSRSKPQKIYSAKGSALLTIENVTETGESWGEIELPPHVDKTEHCALIQCRKYDLETVLFIEKHITHQLLPNSDSSKQLRVKFNPDNVHNLIQTDNCWNPIVDSLNLGSKLLICGGKGVGKSTFLRHALNRLLLRHKSVRIIDLDPGQPEFTPPGLISVLTIQNPILSNSNYDHLLNSDFSLLANVNIEYEAEKYLQTVKILADFVAKQDSNLPTLINYMGYTQDLGLNVFGCVSAILQPSNVVEIVSPSGRGFEVEVRSENAKKFAVLFEDLTASVKDYGYSRVTSLKGDCKELEGWELREMKVLGYFGAGVGSKSIISGCSPLLRIQLNSVQITDASNQAIHPAAINANLVALCRLSCQNFDVFECYGFGIVRGIDYKDNCLVLLVGNVEKLAKSEIIVSHLVLTSVKLPTAVLMTTDDVAGRVPYVLEGSLTDLGEIPKRSRISFRRKF